MSLIYLSCAWVAGILLGSKFDPPLALVLTGLIPLPLLFFGKHRKPIILTGLCLFIFFGGAFYFQSSLPADNEDYLKFYNEKGAVQVKGILSQDPDIRDKATQLRLEAKEINLGGEEWHDVGGTALLFVPRYPTYSYGDVLLVSGELETPPKFYNEVSGEVEFDYESYLAHEGIYSTMLYPEIETLETGQGIKPLEWIYSLRDNLSQTLAEALPEPQASLAQGIILGKRGNIPSSLTDDFSDTGTAHLLAVSGLHLGIMAGSVLVLGIWFFGKRRYLYIWLALVAIWLYALLTGMHAPVVRGAIMASIFLTAELLGRQRSAITALTFAAAIMVGLDPQILLTASFQMSFLAIVGIILIFPRLRDTGRRIVKRTLGEDRTLTPAAYFITDIFSVTLGAIIAVWPVVAYYFGVVSLVGPLANFFALPALPGIIIAGALTSGLGLIALPAAQIVAWLAWLFLSYLLLVVSVFANIPPVEFGSNSATLIWTYYPALALAIWIYSRRSRLRDLAAKSQTVVKPGIGKMGDLISQVPKKWLIPPLLVIVILVSVVAANKPDDNLHVSFLNVGQGDAILIQKGSQQILVDGGPSPQAIALELGSKMPFWDRTIELVVLTHPQADHVTGLVEVLKRYKVEQVLYLDLDYDSSIYKEWLKLIEEKNIKSTIAHAGQQIVSEELAIEVLNPPNPPLTGTEADINNNSLVLQVSMVEISFLLMADTQYEVEFELLSQRAITAITVLKVAHHGSATSTTAEFLAVASPQLAVISVGEDNDFGHPNQEVMARLEELLGPENIYLTDEDGTIEFITDGERLWVRVGE